MATFYIAETAKNGFVFEQACKPTNAKTLAAAKRLATRCQVFQGTTVHVAQMVEGSMTVIASKNFGDDWNDIAG